MKKTNKTISVATIMTTSAFLSCLPCTVQAMDVVVTKERRPSAFTSLKGLGEDGSQVLRSVENLNNSQACNKATREQMHPRRKSQDDLKAMELGGEIAKKNDGDILPQLGVSPQPSEDKAEEITLDLSKCTLMSLWDGMKEELKEEKEDNEFTRWKQLPLQKSSVRETLNSIATGDKFEKDYFIESGSDIE